MQKIKPRSTCYGLDVNFSILSKAVPFLALICATLMPVVASGLERPRIWVGPDDRAGILEKIERLDWVESLFEDLQARADEFVQAHREDPQAFLMQLPMNWEADWEGFPPFHTITRYGDSPGMSQRQTLMHYLQASIDCGVIYYLTGDEAYAQVAADVLGIFASAIARMEPDPSTFNGGIIYPNDHLKEARIIGAQIPLVYDLIANYLHKESQVHDVTSGERRDFPRADAQTVFRMYIDRAINVGLVNNNWPVLESPSLVHNILALDDPEEIQELLAYYLYKDTDHQTSLRTTAKYYQNPGDLYPESLQYAVSVANFNTYLMSILDRLFPNLELGKKYWKMPASMLYLDFLRYPNADVIAFGDGPRRFGSAYSSLERAHRLAIMNDQPDLAKQFGALVLRGIETGEYSRERLSGRNFSASIYTAPTDLLWAMEELTGDPEHIQQPPRSHSLPFAGIYLQRNLATPDPKQFGLMGFVGGAHYVHAHASGMDMELYGFGHVLGINGGRSAYGSDVHENYHRLFAAHNTVIANGASASDGGWVNLGIETTQALAMEPQPGLQAASPYHSFTTTRFNDVHNLVAEAEQQRTLALIRTSDTTGYYVDVFRSRSDHEEQFHDYLYHNIGDELKFIDLPEGFSLEAQPERFKANEDLPWQRNNKFRHPGWHFFEDVESSPIRSSSPNALFVANDLGAEPIMMKVHINDADDRSYTRVMAPSSSVASPPYNERKTPTMVIRQQGDAWEQPFAMVFEALQADPESGSVRSVSSIVSGERHAGLEVISEFEGMELRQYVLIAENLQDRIECSDRGFVFDGHFAVISLHQDELQSVYIGSGKSLKFRGQSFRTSKGGSLYFSKASEPKH